MRFPVRSSRLLAVVLAVLAAVVALTPPAAAAAAAARSAAGTRVGASRPVMIFTVGASTAVSAGGGRRGPAFRLHLAVGACVAAEDAGEDAADSCATTAGATAGGESFTASTKVLLASGAAVSISQLKPGDKVLATDTKTGKTLSEAVTAVLLHYDTWLRLLALDSDLAKAEPKTLRYRILHAAARLVHGRRRRRWKFPANWPWSEAITRAWHRICALPDTC